MQMSERVNRVLYMVLSLLLAIALWLYVDDAQKNTIPRDFTGVPIEFIGAEDTLPSRNLMLAEGQDATVDLKLSGPRSVITNLRKSDIRLQIDLTDVNAVGTYTRTYELLTSDTVDRSSITLERASRTAVTIQVATLYSQEVPVTVNVEGSVPDGYMYMSDLMVAEPSSLVLSGRVEDVDQVKSARIVVDLDGATSTVQRDFTYELLDSEGNVVENEDIRVSDRRVQVIAPVYLTKELPLTVKYKESPGSNQETTRCKLEHDSITVAGEPASLESIEEIVLGEVDLSSFLSDISDYPLEIRLPAGCVNLSGITSTNLSIRFRGVETKNFSVTNIQATGLSDNQKFDKITTSVDVVLRGPAADLEQVTADDIRIVVDLTEYTSDITVGNQPGKVLVDGYDNVGAAGGPYSVSGKISSK